MTSAPEPRITVLLAVHNGQEFLRPAIDSVLGQTYPAFEFLIVDDGSTDDTPGIIGSYGDPRMVVITNETNINRSRSLNRGLSQARGEFVARMDADDICAPTRLERQAAFLDAHPEIDLVGSWIRTFGDVGGVTWRLPTNPVDLDARMLFHSELAHPSVMFRTKAFAVRGLEYHPEMLYSEDWELWHRAGAAGIGMSNIPQVLLRYRVKTPQERGSLHAPEKTAAKRNEVHAIIAANLDRIGVDYDEDEVELHRALGFHDFPDDDTIVPIVEEWLRRLIESNEKSQRYDPVAFRRAVAEWWFYTCYAFADRGPRTWRWYAGSPLRRLVAVAPMRWAKFAFRTATRQGPRSIGSFPDS